MKIQIDSTDIHSVLDHPDQIDALEIHGVRAEQGADGGLVYGVDEENPVFFSVYAQLKRGGMDWIADFPNRRSAGDYAESIASEHGWPVYCY